MIPELKVSPVLAADSTVGWGVCCKTGEMAIGKVHGRFFEAVSRGTCFYASTGFLSSITSLSSSVTGLGLYNPLGSTVLLSVLDISSAIQAAGAADTVALLVGVTTNPINTATSITLAPTNVGNCLLGGAAGVGKPFRTATLGATPSVARCIGNLSGTQVTAANTVIWTPYLSDLTDGKIVLAPNSNIVIQTNATTETAITTIIWEEIPIV